MDFYQIYNLNICSDMSLPELRKAELVKGNIAEVTIRAGLVSPKGLDHNSGVHDFIWQASPDQLLLSVTGVARFLVRQGNEIIYQPLDNADEDTIRLFLLGSCMGALLLQRGFLVLHGNAFEVDNYGVMCVGQSGAGKSTLAAEMMRRGHRIIADDVCPIDIDGMVISGMPRIKLWQDSADRLRIDTSRLSRITPALEKFNYPLGRSYCDRSLPIKFVYILNSSDEKGFKFDRISGRAKFELLHQNTYRYEYLKGMGLSQKHLTQCGRLAKKTQLTQIYRPKEGFQLEELADFILDDVCQTELVAV